MIEVSYAQNGYIPISTSLIRPVVFLLKSGKNIENMSDKKKPLPYGIYFPLEDAHKSLSGSVDQIHCEYSYKTISFMFSLQLLAVQIQMYQEELSGREREILPM